MMWLTWRQLRIQTATVLAALLALAVALALTGSDVLDAYHADARTFLAAFDASRTDRTLYLVGIAVVYAVPAVIGVFWGAPLIARELEAGTHRLVWNQSTTRNRWLAVKLGLVGLAAIAAAGLGSLAVTLWSDSIDKAAAGDFPRMAPLLFDARGIVPIGYAAFAFALGVTAGMLVRRTLPAMAITLAVFAVVQIAMPPLVRRHLSPPVRASVAIDASSLDGLSVPGGGGPIQLHVQAPGTGADAGRFAGAWILSGHTIDPSGRAITSILAPQSGACARPPGGRVPPPAGAKPGAELSGCFAEIKRLGYRQRVTYQPASRFWAFQWYETGIYIALALGLAGFCFWRIRHRLS